MKKVITVGVLAAAMTVIGAAGVFAQGTDKVEVDGVKFEIPEDIRDLVTVETDGLEKNELVKVSETASMEASKANGEDVEGAGWLFTIGTVTEKEMLDDRCSGACDGKDFFAEDDDIYYVFYHPTDVRFVRETTDQMEEDQADWSKVNEWANGVVRDEIVKNNPELDAKHYSYTSLDSYLCQIADDRGIVYEIHSLEYPDLDASAYKDKDFIEDLTEDVTYAYIDEPEVADGESIVLAFPENDVRYEFLLDSDQPNVIREVITTDGDETIYYYEAAFEEPDKTAAGIMKDWVNAIANGDADDDDDGEDDD